MGELTLRKKIPYRLIPDILQSDFENIILETYLDSGWHDLHNLAFHVDTFAVFAASYEETGDPFDYVDDGSREITNQMIIRTDFNQLLEDVHAVLNYYHMFHSWLDGGTGGSYEYIECINMPIIEVW